MLSIINKILFSALIIILAATFFTRENYRGVDEIDPTLLSDPIQTEVADRQVIKFVKDEYEYELTPLYQYTISGLVVHKLDYTFFSIYKRDSVFPLDLCMIWGENTKSKVYQSKSVQFSQDARFCFYRWQGKITFDHTAFSNNHLVLNNAALEKKMKKISTGDQVEIKGKLVNIKATNLGEAGTFDPEVFEWNSSTDREDTGAGACETIYVESIKILKKSNPISHNLYELSFYGLIALFGINILALIIKVMAKPQKNFKA